MRNAFWLQFLVLPLLFFSAVQNDSCNKPAPPPQTKTTPATPTASALTNRLKPGRWGGNHISLEVSETETTLEFDCANGTISKPITLDENGRFSLPGKYVREGPGPVRQGDAQDSDAEYSGRLNAGTLTITVHIAGAPDIGPFSLTEGRQGKITKCM
jgi:hypothetical protein